MGNTEVIEKKTVIPLKPAEVDLQETKESKKLDSHSIEAGKFDAEVRSEPLLITKRSEGERKHLDTVSQEAGMKSESDTLQTPQQALSGKSVEIKSTDAPSIDSSKIDALKSKKTAEEIKQLDVFNQEIDKITETGTPKKPLQVDSQKIVEAKQLDNSTTVSTKLDKEVTGEAALKAKS